LDGVLARLVHHSFARSSRKPRSCLFPLSKIRTGLLYDDRMVQVCRAIRGQTPTHVRELVEQIASTETFKGGNRKSPAELKQNYRIAGEQLQNLGSVC
jgi:hypothetical protein